MPAFIDPHSHITAYASNAGASGFIAGQKFCGDEGDPAGFYEPEGSPQRRVLIGFGYDHNRLAEHRHPDKALLNTVSAEIPVMITHKSGHMAR